MIAAAIRNWRLPAIRLWPRRKRKTGSTAVLSGYVGRTFLYRHRILLRLIFGFFLFIYGVAFTLLGWVFPMPFTVPLVVLAGLVIWALPDTGRIPVRWLEWLLYAYLISVMAWPDYLAIALPGLPWITVARLLGFPLVLTYFFCLSLSHEFREQVRDIMGATPWVWKLMIAYSFISIISIFYSTGISLSISKVIVAIVNWVLIYFISLWVFSRKNRANYFAVLIWIFVFYNSVIAFLEWRVKAPIWAGHIPSFLKIDSDLVQDILDGGARHATGIYRVQSKFTTPLSLAEVLACATPILLHFMMTSRQLWIRILAAVTIVFAIYAIFRTGSRLGMVGLLLTGLIYLLAWSVLRWRDYKDSIFGPAIVIAYPLLFALGIGASFAIGRIRNTIWGNGAQAASNMARQVQIEMGLPKILSHPFGYGFGRGGYELGFYSPGGKLTIDNYYLSVALDIGIIGFLVYFAIFIAQIIYGAKYAMKVRTLDTLLIVPITIGLFEFLVIKSVLSQTETHAIFFAMLGAVTALVWQIKRQEDDVKTIAMPATMK